MQMHNWFIIDGFLFNDFIPIVNILNTLMGSDKKYILFSHYFFRLEDCDEIYKQECVNEEFEYYKIRADSSINYDELENKVKDMLYNEYSRIYKIPYKLSKEDLYGKFLNDEINFFDEKYIQSVKEFIAREMTEPMNKRHAFINDRKVFVNKINTSFTVNRLLLYSEHDHEYVWYSPKSKNNLSEIVKDSGSLFNCIITEDINNFDNYLYAVESFEEKDFLLAINDRVGNFKSTILPEIEKFLTKNNVVFNEKEYFRNKKISNKKISNKR